MYSLSELRCRRRAEYGEGRSGGNPSNAEAQRKKQNQVLKSSAEAADVTYLYTTAGHKRCRCFIHQYIPDI